MSDPNGLTWAATLVSLAVAIPTAGHAVIYKRDPRSATLWVLLSGMVLVMVFALVVVALVNLARYLWHRVVKREAPGEEHTRE